MTHDSRDVHALCLGWDVGGWHGSRDGLGALVLRADGTVDVAGSPVRCSLGREIAEGRFSLDVIVRRLAVASTPDAVNRVVLGIDAPFALPESFTEAVGTPLNVRHGLAGGLPADYIENRLAFRFTDREVFRLTGKHPMSASFNLLTNSTMKGRAALSQLAATDSDDVRVLPFDHDDEDARLVVIEVYPALWKREGCARNPALRKVLEALPEDLDPDAVDGVLSALTAAAYEATRMELESDLPWILPPPSQEPRVRTEGWIYIPACAERQR